MKCKFCQEKAIYNKLCKEHFSNFTEKRVEKYLNSVGIKDKKVLVALSGGKDSSVLAHVLNKLKSTMNFEFELYYIHLKIKAYSDHGLEKCKELASLLDLKLNYEFVEIPIDDINKKWTIKPICSVCGLIKRYMINKFAYENKFDFVATGHNLDDEFFFNMNNLLNNNIEYFHRDKKKIFSKPEFKLVGKLKPLYYLQEKENLIYCLINKIPFYNEECPYGKESSQLKGKEKFLFFNKDEKRSLINSFNKLKTDPQVTGEIKYCEKCGYPSSNDLCAYCYMIDKYGDYSKE